MFEIQCDECGEELVHDAKETLDSYMKDMDYTVEEEGKIVEESIQQYLVYRCLLCEKLYKFTYKEWEARYRKVVAQQAMEIKKQRMFSEHINPQSIDPDNGLEYCGQCSGYANDGYCLVDIINQCTIRKEK